MSRILTWVYGILGAGFSLLAIYGVVTSGAEQSTELTVGMLGIGGLILIGFTVLIFSMVQELKEEKRAQATRHDN